MPSTQSNNRVESVGRAVVGGLGMTAIGTGVGYFTVGLPWMGGLAVAAGSIITANSIWWNRVWEA